MVGGKEFWKAITVQKKKIPFETKIIIAKIPLIPF